MKDIIAIGDATLDTFIELDKARVNCSIKKDQCLLCINSADKIPISKLEKKVAGNAANVAVGASRLELKSAFLTKLGDDDFAKEVIRKMKAEGVSTKYVQKEKGKESNFTVVLNYHAERTQLIYRIPRQYDLPKNLEKARFIYLTAMGENHQMTYPELVTYLLKYNIKLAYNPGKYQITCKEQICHDLLPYTDILFVNKEEAVLILSNVYGTSVKRRTIKSLLKALHELGAEIVIITDGPKGSYALADNRYYHMPIFEGPVVERTGAGDAYATGFVSAIAHGKGIEEGMVWGTFNSWSVVQYVGPIDGLLKLSQIKKLIKQHPKIKPTQL